VDSKVPIIFLLSSLLFFLFQIYSGWRLGQVSDDYSILAVASFLAFSFLTSLFILGYKTHRRIRQSDEMLKYLEKIAHDLKAPLLSLSIYAEKIFRNLDNDKEKEQWLWVVKQLEWLKLVVQRPLDFRLIRSGKLKAEFQVVEIRPLVLEIADVFKLIFPEQVSRLTIEGEEVSVRTDPVRIKQVFSNLINNALKYTTGKVWVGWKKVPSQNSVEVTIADEGPGLPQQFADLLTCDTPKGKNAPIQFDGHGLGICISAGLLKSCGSRLIYVPSTKGTTWNFRLPMASQIQDKAWKNKRINICLIEDDPVYAQLFVERVKDFANVKIIKNVKQFLSYLSEHDFRDDLIISDVHLTDNRGSQIIEVLKKKGLDTKGFYLISAQAESATSQEPSRSAYPVHPKPLTPGEFERMFDNIFKASLKPLNF